MERCTRPSTMPMWPRPPRTTPSRRLGRRQFLALAGPALLVPSVIGWRLRSAEAATGSGGYVVDVVLLYGVFGFHLDGTLTQTVDPATGRYQVTARGRGTASRIASNRQACSWAEDGYPASPTPISTSRDGSPVPTSSMTGD